MKTEYDLINNIHFRCICKGADHVPEYYQKNQQSLYIIKMIISLSCYVCSPLFYIYPVVSIPSFYKNRKQVQEVSPTNEFTFLAPFVYPFLKQVQEVSPASWLC